MNKSATVTQSYESALAARHAMLESRLAREAQRPHPDSTLVAQLKKAKLRIKDALLSR
jgi:uncharacterized protein